MNEILNLIYSHKTDRVLLLECWDRVMLIALRFAKRDRSSAGPRCCFRSPSPSPVSAFCLPAH